MRVICWGTRGSFPSPLTPQETTRKVVAATRRALDQHLTDPDAINGEELARRLGPDGRAGWTTYGGDTSCVEIHASDDLAIVIDLGTGFRHLSHQLVSDSRANRLIVFMSHLHMDHVIGLPLSTIAYQSDAQIDIYGQHRHDVDLARFMQQVQSPPFFPVALAQMGARFTFHDFEASDEPIWRSPAGQPRVAVRACPVDHPNGCVSFRVETDGGSLIYASDRETPGRSDEAFASFARGATHLLHDSQYTPEQYAGQDGPERRGWGHSTYQASIETALDADVEHLVLWHHDQDRTDEQLDGIGRLATQHMARRAEQRGCKPIPTSMAYDGMTLDI